MQTLWQDLRFGFRTLTRKPGFTIVAIIALALGIGANTAIFSVVNSVLLRPLAYREPERLVVINHDYPKLSLKATVSAIGYTHYRDNAKSFESVVAMTGGGFNLTGGGDPEQVNGSRITHNFFSALGAEARLGRVFLPEEDQPGRNKVVVLSHGFWQRRFGGDPGIVNKNITLNDESYTVVGVMPPSFQFGRETGQVVDLWTPIAFTPQQLSYNNLTNEFLFVFARLKPGVTIGQAQAELDTIADNLRRQYLPWAGRKRRSDPGNPDVCPVFDYHKVFSPPAVQAEAAHGCRTAGIGCLDCKGMLLQHLVPALAPIRERRLELTQDPGRVEAILHEGSKRAQREAAATLAGVREAMRLN